jgi:hypothetical protein
MPVHLVRQITAGQDLRPTSGTPQGGAVAGSAAVPADLPGDHRWITADPCRDLLELQTLGQAPGDLLPIEQGQHLPYGGILFPPKTKIKYFDRLNSSLASVTLLLGSG